MNIRIKYGNPNRYVPVKTKKTPKFLPETPVFDSKLEWVGIIALVISWGFSLYVYRVSSGDLPTHFDATGKVDAYGNKITVLVLPLISTLLFAGMSWLNHYPEKFNYPIKITERNKEAEYRAAMRTIRGMKLAVVLVFLLITMAIFISENSAGNKVVAWLLPSILLLSFAPLIIYFATAKKRIKP